ncbi:Tektin-1 [Liparis tanakae]|uniref:Tektin n=1 Tax=Liparis tanakae TaxID=230148 RepID=A0A4Z2FQI3_9TELE|nr:Tektin-1 [Liparis tanakae]
MSVPSHSPQQGEGTKLMHFEVLRNSSELFRAECTRLMLETEKACKRMQNDDSKRLDQRVRDIQFLKKELELKLEEVVVEIDALVALQSRVAKALEACTRTLNVSVVCLEERRKHLPSRRLHDEVDGELLKEKEAVEGVASLLQRVAEQITEQIRLDRSAKYQLEKDLKEKFEAECIDNSCLLMTRHSINSLQRAGDTGADPPRALVECLLEQTAADMQRQVGATAAAFQLNVREIKSAKSQTEDQLAATVSELASQERIAEDLQVAVAERGQALSVARARLALRRQRPGKEQFT